MTRREAPRSWASVRASWDSSGRDLSPAQTVEDGRISRTEVEALAYESRESINASQAAEILGVNKSRVGQLADAGLLPFEGALTGADGTGGVR
jgi:hypothetical protein